MCGIVGVVAPGEPDTGLVRRMCDVIRHRGPDDEGYFFDDGVALGMRRLAIIDIASGNQPVFNEDRSVAVVFNGEIYNHRDLRRQLERAGHRFTSLSDTECIAHLYEQHGTRFVDHLRGMFAIGIWDAKHRRLVLARDRVGKKPLFYRVTETGLWFGSELKSLLQDPAFVPELDLVALHHYLTYQYVPSPWSIYSGVRKLPPGHVLVYEASRAVVERYWALSYLPKHEDSDDVLVGRLRSLINEATRLRMVSERPLGAFLSGGLDSSLVVAAMAEHSTNPVKTFAIGFSEPSFDERSYARLTADRFATDLRMNSGDAGDPRDLAAHGLALRRTVCRFLGAPELLSRAAHKTTRHCGLDGRRSRRVLRRISAPRSLHAHQSAAERNTSRSFD